MPLILATPGDRLHWLTPEELKATGLATDRLDGEQLLARAASLPLPQQAAGQVSEDGSGVRDEAAGARN
jgi:hypothetical protein